MIVYLALSDEPRGLVVDDGTRAFLIPSSALDHRRQLAADVHERTRDCRSMLRNTNPDLDRLLVVQGHLAAWDHHHLFDPFIQRPEPGGVVEYVIGHSADLQMLSLNASLHSRYLAGAMSAADFAASFAWVGHGSEGFEHLRRRLDTHRRRSWNPEHTTLLVCTRGCPGVIPFVGDLAHLPNYIERYPDAAIQPAVVDTLLGELESLAAQLGVHVRVAAQTEELFAHLAEETEEHQTLLLAHQHDGWLHLHDRKVAIAEVFTAARANPYGGSWYLAVCGAAGPRQLAGALQACGRAFVTTGGPVSIVQDQLGLMAELLRQKIREPDLGFEAAIRQVQIGS